MKVTEITANKYYKWQYVDWSAYKGIIFFIYTDNKRVYDIGSVQNGIYQNTKNRYGSSLFSIKEFNRFGIFRLLIEEISHEEFLLETAL